MLCKNNPFIFFGKPVISLTNYQKELFSTGLRYKNVIETKNKTPPPLMSLTEMKKWYNGLSGGGSGSGGDSDGGDEGGGSTIIGADKDELKDMVQGGKNVVDLHKSADKIMGEGDKKHLDMMDMLKLHGEIE